MPLAARAMDTTSHGSPLSPGLGSPDVRIGGKSAWRATADSNTCPLVSGVVPHAGGLVAFGSKTVLINNLPAARLGDTIVEAGPPNTIASGCPTVDIG